METLKKWWQHETWWKRWCFRIAAVLPILVLITIIGNYISNLWAFWDQDPERGALAVAQDVFGDRATKIVYLDNSKDPKHWRLKDSLWFDNITQGSDLIPYDFFLSVEQPDGKLFRNNDTMNNRYRYLVRKPTFNNPDGLPIGLVKDTHQGRAFMGFTCAACHTGQVNYNGTGIRIDGAPAMADMDTFLADLSADISTTSEAGANPALHARFVKRVLALGHYKSQDKIDADLKTYSLRLATYRLINRSDTQYGYARLDAFGRIYNQVLQYVMSTNDIQTAADMLVAKGALTQADLDGCGFTATLKGLKTREKRDGYILKGPDRDRLLESLAKIAFDARGKPSAPGFAKLLKFRDQMFNAPNAPVSYPFIWDIPQHDYVQWNGIASNAALGPIGRNTGEVIGVFGTMNWSRSKHWTPEGVLSGQGWFNSSPIDFSSSVNVHNLALIEDKLKTLYSPVWPQNILPNLDVAKIARGEVVFAKYCSACHAEINRTDPNRRVVAHMSAQSNIGTDPQMAVNSAAYAGYSGILRNTYVGIGPGSVLINKQAPVAALLTKATFGVVSAPDSDKWWWQRFAEWVYDVIFSLRSNDIQPSMKNGDYDPDTTADPLSSIMAYKGRSLNGIWATAPYLHNGSVPDLYDLLLPAEAKPGDPAGTKYRPTQFVVGSREFDPVKVGFKSDGYAGFVFQTDKLGNSNKGHEFGTRDTKDEDGNLIKDKDGNIAYPALTEQQRWDLVEYLKSL
ncbi:MAG: di-heme-cytochrome C peroxidase [Rhizomicrobium sp.]